MQAKKAARVRVERIRMASTFMERELGIESPNFQVRVDDEVL
jgi:hypothetical protein